MSNPTATRRRGRTLLAVLALGVLWPAAAQAQEWRTVTSMRQYGGERALRVDMEYGAGVLEVSPAEEGMLYRTRLRYDADLFDPEVEYDDGRLQVGLDGKGGIRLRKHEAARLELALGPDAPLDLDLAFGAVQAQIELGGLRIRKAEISTGASETKLRFSEPNPVRAERLDLEVGAASFGAYGLGNANAERLSLEGGVGDILLDFTGAWHNDLHADIEVGVGSLTLRIPRELGVRVIKDSFLASFDSQRLIKRGNAYYSENWEDAEHRLTVNIDAAFGSIDIRWVDNDPVAL